jgi:hypothetical protein
MHIAIIQESIIWVLNGRDLDFCSLMIGECRVNNNYCNNHCIVMCVLHAPSFLASCPPRPPPPPPPPPPPSTSYSSSSLCARLAQGFPASVYIMICPSAQSRSNSHHTWETDAGGAQKQARRGDTHLIWSAPSLLLHATDRCCTDRNVH